MLNIIMSFLDEPVSQIISIGLECNTIIEKINKMTHKEMENMVLSSLASSGKRINPTLKKLLELESTISMLRQTLGKTNLLYISESKSKDDSSIKDIEVKKDEPKIIDKAEETNDKSEKDKAESTKDKAESTKDKAEKEKAKDKPEETKAKVEKAKNKPEKAKVEKAKVEKAKVEKDKAEKDKAEKDKSKDKSESTKAEKAKDKPEANKDNVKEKAKAEATKEKDKTEIQEDVILKSSDDLHEPGNQKSDEPLHIRRKNIPRHVKTLVWGKYIGNDKPEALCYSCRHERIDIRSFHCGHVISEANGGTCMLNNLRPICAPCNGSMGTMSMNEFTQTFFGWNV